MVTLHFGRVQGDTLYPESLVSLRLFLTFFLSCTPSASLSSAPIDLAVAGGAAAAGADSCRLGGGGRRMGVVAASSFGGGGGGPLCGSTLLKQ